MTRSLVSGAGGFIGGHLVKALLDRGDTVVAADIKPIDEWKQVHPQALNLANIDLGNEEDTFAVAQECEEIYHLAADAGGMMFIANNKAACTLNVLADAQIIKAAHQSNAKVWYASSACIYPLHLQQTADAPPLREEDAYANVDPEEAYGWEKIFAERMYLAHATDYGMHVRIGRYQSVFGPKGVWRGGREKAPTAICRKVATAKIKGEDFIEVWGNGTAIRTFTYVDDAVDATLTIMASDYGQPLNVGTGEAISIDQLVSTIEDIAEYKVRRVWVDGPVGVPGARRCDNTRTLAMTGWQAKVSVREGLERTYAWVYNQLKKELHG